MSSPRVGNPRVVQLPWCRGARRERAPARAAAGRVVHQGDRRLDGDVPRLRVRLVHRVLGRQRARAPRKDEPTAAAAAAAETAQHHRAQQAGTRPPVRGF